MLLFALLGTPDIWLRVLSRILLIPVIAGLAYELLRLGGKYPNSALMPEGTGPVATLPKLKKTFFTMKSRSSACRIARRTRTSLSAGLRMFTSMKQLLP